jgi:Ca-activated chloride channel family protein
MSFEHPIAFVVPLVFLLCKYLCPAKTEAIFFPNTVFFERQRKFTLTDFLSVLFISVALASPITKKTIINNNIHGYDIVAVLDTSGSMIEYDKIEIAKSIIAKFADKRKNDRMGLVVFGNIAYIASPLTFDKKTFKEILNKIFVGIAGKQTAIYDALFLSANLFKNSTAKNKIIILITDGQDNSSITPLDVAIKRLKQNKIKVYAIGLGPFVNSQVLERIAKQTDGKFFYLTNPNQLKDVFAQIDKLEKSKIKANKIVLKKYYFQYPLILGLVFYLLFLLNYRRSIWNF